MTIMIRPSFEAGRPVKATDLPLDESDKSFMSGGKNACAERQISGLRQTAP
jgi:hypothetical protein